MSLDTEYSGGGGRMAHEQMHDRVRPLHQRVLPFIGLVLVAVLALPALELACWGIGLLDDTTGRYIRWAWIISGIITAMVAMGIGFKVSRRITFVIWHVVVTALVVCLGAALTTEIGWTSRAWDVIHIFSLGTLAVSWALYRIDALRAVAQGKSEDGWGAVLGLARSRPRKITHDDAHVYVQVEHGPGETTDNVRSAAKKLESAAGAIEGTTVVTPGERADTSTITMTMADPFAKWRNWAGLSHPGGSFAHPFRTAYYATGVDQWFSFVRSLPSSRTKFRSEGATFVGAAGTTGSGKSGFLTNTAAETLSRTDAVVIWVDADKLFQNAGWCMDMLAMAAKDRSGIRTVTKALRKLAEYRVALFGQAQLDSILDPSQPQIGREWTPELAQELREPAVLVIGDEMDRYVDTEDWRWLAARGRSLGIFLLLATPRASTAEVPALIRGSVSTWKTFAVGDTYSDGFTLSQDTADAGADPKKFRAPGLHYLDRAPGVDPRMYATPAREFKSDPAQLRAEVKACRADHPPMTLSPGSVEYMGEWYEKCRPDVVMGVRAPESAGDDEPQDFDANDTQRLPAAPSDSDDDGNEHEIPEEQPVRPTAAGTVPENDEVAPLDQHSLDPELARELAGVDPHRELPIPNMKGGPVAFDAPGGKPRWSPEETEAELDQVLIQFASEGKMTFENSEVQEAMRCEFAAVTCTRRLTALDSGARISPPGLKVERMGRGRWQITKRPQPRPNQ
jgi:hypothetical protein